MPTSFYQGYQTGGGTKPTDDEDPSSLPPFSIGGAPSPAQQIAQTGNTGMNMPGIGTGTTPAKTEGQAQTATNTQKVSTTDQQAAAAAQSTVGNSTAGTTPPPTTTGSSVPPYAASYAFWQNGSWPGASPAGAVYTPGQQQDFYGNLPQ